MKEWVPYKLKEITTKIGSGSTPTGGKEAYYQSGITLVRSLNIYDFAFELQNLAFINEVQAKKLNGVTIEKDDILLNITGASVGRCTIIPEYLLPARVNQHVSIIRCNKEKADSKFLLYCINSASYKDALMSIADSGATREALTKDDIEKFQILLPPLHTQKRIASILSTFDDLIEVNNQRIKLLEETARELYKEWFVRMRFPGYKEVKFVKGVPEGWEVVQLSELVKLISGYAFKSEDFTDNPTDRTAVRMGNFQEHGGLQFNDNTKYLETEVLVKNKFHVSHRDILIVLSDVTRDGRIIGNVGFVPSFSSGLKFIINQRVSKIEINEVLKYWFYAYLNSQDFKNYCLTRADSATVLNLSNDHIYKHLVMKPQYDLVIKFSNIYEPFISQIENLNEQNTQLRQIRDRLLPRLISGKLEVKISKTELSQLKHNQE